MRIASGAALGAASYAALRASRRIAGMASRALKTAVRLRRLRAQRARPGGALAGALILSEACADALRIHGVELEVSGAAPPEPALLVANHVSYLDPIAILALWPCLPVAKIEVSRWPVFGPLARMAGVHFVDWSCREDRTRVVSALAGTLVAGVSALNFPEGTTSDGLRTQPFRTGGFEAALMTGAPVIPVAVRLEPKSLAWTGDASFLPHYLRFSAEARPRIRVRAGEAIAPLGDPAALAARCRSAVDRLLEEMP